MAAKTSLKLYPVFEFTPKNFSVNSKQDGFSLSISEQSVSQDFIDFANKFKLAQLINPDNSRYGGRLAFTRGPKGQQKKVKARIIYDSVDYKRDKYFFSIETDHLSNRSIPQKFRKVVFRADPITDYYLTDEMLEDGGLVPPVRENTGYGSVIDRNASQISTNTNPPINLGHIFNGEQHGGNLKGYHSSAEGGNSNKNIDITGSARANGVYTIKWNFKSSPSVRKKSSSMFPDSCSSTQVVNSILYAFKYIGDKTPFNVQAVDKPFEGGPSGPTSENSYYCMGNDSSQLTVYHYPPSTSLINTSFPQY